MCEFSVKLIAWLDGELPADEAANLARHVRVCDECRTQADVYGRVSETIDAYCDLALVSRAERRFKSRRWRPVLAATAATAAALLLFWLTGGDERLRALFSPAPDASPAIALKAPVVAAPTVEKMSAATAVAENRPKRVNSQRLEHGPEALKIAPIRNANWFPGEAPVYIAIPADALFPPGAFPEGVGFVADVNLRADGSAQRLRLQPQLVGFQTRGTRP